METLPPVELTLPRSAPAAVVQRVPAEPALQGRPLADWLQTVPGLHAAERGNHAQDAQLSLRGFGARSSFGVRGVRVFVDGVPQTPPDGGGSSTGLPLAGVEHIDILRGPFSALYGSNSGGVIALATRRPEQAESQALLRSAGGGERLLALQHGGRGWGVAAERWRSEGERAQARAERDQFDARWAEGPWRAAASWHDQQAQDPQGLTPAQWAAQAQGTAPPALAFDTRKRTRAGQLSLRWRQDGRSVAAWWGQRRVWQWQSIPVAVQAAPSHPGGVIALQRAHAGVDLRQRAQLGGWQLSAGLQAETQQDQRRGYENFIGPQTGLTGALRRDERNAADAVELYAQAQRALDAQTTLHAGLRAGSLSLRSRDRFLANGDDSGARRLVTGSPALGLSHRSNNDWLWFANAGAAQETPTLNELAYRADGSAGFNTALGPQRSRQLEAGLRGKGLQLTLFGARSRDEIVVASSSGGRTAFRNAARTRRQGLELGWQGALGGGWSLQTALTTLSARLDDGQRLPGAPARRGTLDLRWQKDQVSLLLRAQGQSRLSAGAGQSVPGFGLLQAQGQWRLGDWQLAWGVDNLFDRRHAATVIVAEASGRFIEPGAPRRVWISLGRKS